MVDRERPVGELPHALDLARTSSAEPNTAPMLPRPPASDTAATSSGVTAGQIAACRIGASMLEQLAERRAEHGDLLGFLTGESSCNRGWRRPAGEAESEYEMANVEIQFEGLSKRFGKVQAVKDLSFDVEPAA